MVVIILIYDTITMRRIKMEEGKKNNMPLFIIIFGVVIIGYIFISIYRDARELKNNKNGKEQIEKKETNDIALVYEGTEELTKDAYLYGMKKDGSITKITNGSSYYDISNNRLYYLDKDLYVHKVELFGDYKDEKYNIKVNKKGQMMEIYADDDYLYVSCFESGPLPIDIYDLETGEKETTKLRTDNAYAYAYNGKFYYQEYTKDEYLNVYDVKTKAIKHIAANSNIEYIYGNKIIYYMTKKSSTGAETHTVYLYDIETGKSSLIKGGQISESTESSLFAINGNTVYYIVNHKLYKINNGEVKELATLNAKKLNYLEYNMIKINDDKFIITAIPFPDPHDPNAAKYEKDKAIYTYDVKNNKLELSKDKPDHFYEIGEFVYNN